MLRTTTDYLNLASRTRSVVRQRHPDEAILFATAVTILETSNESPIGWSLRRFFQRRGNVVVTDARVFIQSSFLSLITLVWLAVIGYSACGIWQNGHVHNIVMVLVGALFIVQRRPYSRDLPFDMIGRVEFGSVRGITARGDIISIVTDGVALQLVTVQNVPSNIRERLLALRDAGVKA